MKKKTKNRIRFAFIMMFMVAIGFSMTACCSTTPKPQQTDPAVEAAAEEIVEAVKAEAEKEEEEIEEIEDIEEKVDVEEDIPDEEELFDDVEPFDAYSLFNKDAEIEETVLYDENGVKITANSLLYGNYGISLNVTLENNSDKKLTFVAESLGYSVNAVNGFMIEDGYLLDEIKAGQGRRRRA